MTLKNEWIAHCLRLSATSADLYASQRKILRHRQLTFTSLDDSLTLADAGYTKNKLQMLTRSYLHIESRDMAVKLWEKRREQSKYGSVGFSCYNHLVKGDVGGHTSHGSIFGPCIQSAIITWIAKDRASVTVTYRTTELFKKFAPDLVFIRDILLSPFNFSGMKIEYKFFFANITCHSMFWITLVPHLDNPIAELEKVRKMDPYFHGLIVRWSSCYIIDKHLYSIEKFGQALRVRKDALQRIDKPVLSSLRKYLNKYPGSGRGVKHRPTRGE